MDSRCRMAGPLHAMAVFACIAWMPPLAAQERALEPIQEPIQEPGPRLGKSGERAMPFHRPHPEFPPEEALRHLVRGNQAMLATTRLGPGRNHLPPPLRRPAGAGRHLAAVAMSAGQQRSASELFSCRHRDLLVLQSPGPQLRTAEIAALERAAREQRLSLLAILVHPQDLALAKPGDGATRCEHEQYRNILAAHRLARTAGVPVAEAHGLLQAEVVWRTSPWLSALRRGDRFRIAVGVLSPTTGGVRWVTRWERELPIVVGAPGR